MNLRVVISLLCTYILFSGCSGGYINHDKYLDDIVGMVSDSPREALSKLDSIDAGTLSDRDRHFYDFLTIKARDKAYIIHDSDSLILNLIDYYSHHQEEGLYPEVLYYGGRVYSDLGDSPTALRYFHDALDAIPDETKYRKLRSTILSQTGRLLNSLRLYEEAIPYLKEALRIERILNDSIGETSDLLLLGSIYLRKKDYNVAENYFEKAFEKSHTQATPLNARSSMYLAAVKLRKNEIDSALKYIRNIPEIVNPMARNSALAYATEIYTAADLIDTAYYYAHLLIESEDDLNKAIGYNALMSSKLRTRIEQDSLFEYMDSFVSVVEKRFDENENQLALNQQAFYNYQLHEESRIKAESYNARLLNWIFGLLIIISLSAFLILYYRNKNNRSLLQLSIAVNNLDNLTQEIASLKAIPKVSEASGCDHTKESSLNCNGLISPQFIPTKESLRESLRNRLKELAENKDIHCEISQIILQSDVYKKLWEMIKQSKCIKKDDNIWEEIENTVQEVSPSFISNLHILTSGKLTDAEREVALLIKCGFPPAKMMILLSLTNGAVNSRRESLSNRIYDDKLPAKIITRVICLL
ncbi:MAG: tetratricopeptide repeat protein [Bacteroides sp.]|nr:tetratricopeptide repeat protein [Bacteroides sp.]